MKKILIGLASVCVCLNVHAAEVKRPLQSGIAIQPGEPIVVAIQTDKPMEIGWTVDQAAPCSSPCIEAIDTSSRNKDVISSDRGGSKIYRPKDGMIKVEYRNTISRAVTIDIYKVERVCDSEAEACEFLNLNELGDWLVYKIGKFTSIQTSKDGSYSTIEGSTTRGKQFILKAVWWVDDAEENPDQCQEDIAQYIKEGVPISRYSPYILSGRSAAKDKTVLAYIDACIANGSDFAVPGKYVY